MAVAPFLLLYLDLILNKPKEQINSTSPLKILGDFGFVMFNPISHNNIYAINEFC